jgi:hypothetical protein
MLADEREQKPAVAEPERLADYLAGGGMASVGGWCTLAAGYLTWQIGEWQVRHGIKGHVAEIGVHHGRYFLLLALLRERGESAVAMDVFGQQHLNVDASGEGDRAIFERHLATHLGNTAGVLVHEADSLTLGGCNLLSLTRERMPAPKRVFRLFSVDGSHTARHTRSDIETAFSVLCDGGVVIVDDFYNAQWPGVQEGVHDVLRSNSGIAAVAYGENKLFLVHARDHAAYLALFRQQLGEFFEMRKDVELHGREALMFQPGPITAPFDRELRRRPVLGTTFGIGGEAIVQLVSGWSGRERGGTWMTARHATARIELPESLRRLRPASAELRLTFHPFLHPGRSARKLRIATSFGGAFDGTVERRETLVFNIPSAALAEPVTLEFEGDEPDIPADVRPESRDRRPLSFRFGEALIAVDPGTRP